MLRNFSKILKSRWKISLKISLIGGTFIFSIFIVFLLTKVAEISNVKIFVTDFCTFYKKSLKKSLIFKKFLQEFSHIPKVDYLPDWCINFTDSMDLWNLLFQKFKGHLKPQKFKQFLAIFTIFLWILTIFSNFYNSYWFWSTKFAYRNKNLQKIAWQNSMRLKRQILAG